MQMVSEVMTRDVRFVSPQESLQHAAQMMDELNVGALPVCDGEHLVGVVTDRDITVRGASMGKTPQDAHVKDVMSGEVRWCFEDQPVDEVMIQMADSQIRRVPVVSHDEAHRLVGIVVLGDLASKTADAGQKQHVEQVMEMVSTPSEPDRSEQRPGPAGAASNRDDAAPEDRSIRDINTGSAGMHSSGPELAANAPSPGTSAGPGSTQNIGQAAGVTLGAAASGAGAAAGSGGIGLAGGTSAPARNITDAAGGPSTPAGGTTASTGAAGSERATGSTNATIGPRTGAGKDAT
jgi:CBS domain-containing protein